jgi:hypothetical protein
MARKTNAQLAEEKHQLQLDNQRLREELALQDMERQRQELYSRAGLADKTENRIASGEADGNLAKWLSKIELPSLWSVLPWAIAIGVLVFWFRSEQRGAPPGPTPVPSVLSIEKATAQILPTIRQGFADAFEEAAKRVESGQIVNDEQLDAFVNPAITAARTEANKPFDVSFDMGLPRNDDGTFDGREKEVAKFLRQISRSW